MKRGWLPILAITCLALVISCEELEPTPQFSKSDAEFSATPSATMVSVPAADSLQEVLSFTWSDPGYAVGLEQSKFTVKVAANGTSFASFQKKEFTGVLTGALLGKEINGMALKFGGMIGEPITLDAMVVASQANNNEPKNSDVIQITVTPYGDLSLGSSVDDVECAAVTASETAITLEWSTAFNGFSGVKTYELQYAPEGDAYANATTVSLSGFTQSYTQFELNKIALANGVAAGGTGVVEFRIKATNELGTILFSNTKSISITTYIAFNTIAIIGDATAGGWDIDTDMYRPNPDAEPTKWYLVAYLTGGKLVKFRADDGWTDNWGASAFPSGTGVQDGANVPVSGSGYYKIDFDVATGAYSFTSFTPTEYTTVGILGDGAGGWDADIDLTQDVTDPHVWTGTVGLTAADVKLRAEDGWTNNWGAGSFPSGDATQGGPNIPVSADGTYFIWFNDVTGQYFFGPADRSAPYTTVGIIGSATTGDDTGWGSDIDMIQNPSNPYLWSKTFTLFNGESKFRAEDDWGANWGDSAFPSGVGTSGGPNIPTTAGTYFVTFNSLTGEYYFLK